jgi:preprotein translocase subunit SecG
LCEGAAAAAKSADVAIVVLAQTSHEGAGGSHESDVSDVSRSSETRYVLLPILFHQYLLLFNMVFVLSNKQTSKHENNKPDQTNKQTN